MGTGTHTAHLQGELRPRGARHRTRAEAEAHEGKKLEENRKERQMKDGRLGDYHGTSTLLRLARKHIPDHREALVHTRFRASPLGRQC